MEPEIVGKRVKELMKNTKVTMKELAKKMEMNQEVLRNKLEGKEEFYLEEMIKIKEIWNLSLEEADYLFFKKEVEIGENEKDDGVSRRNASRSI